MTPRFSFIIWKMIKKGIKDVRLIPHLMAILTSFACNYVRLRRWRDRSKSSLVIALIEHMGDIIAAEPLSRFARREYPEAAIGWVLRKPYRDLAEDFKSVDKIVTVECMTEWLLLWSAHTSDQVWDLHISERSCPRCQIFFQKPGKQGRVTYDTYYNYGNLLAVNCLSAGLPVINESPRISSNVDVVRAVDKLDLPERIIVIHCKSNEDRRDWNVDKWKTLVNWIIDQTGLTVCEIGSRPYVVQQFEHGTRNLCGSLSIMETTEVLRRAALFIGIDSGPAHLANAAGTPGIILLGRYATFDVYTPYSGGYGDGTLADLVRSDGPASNIEVESVTAQVSKRLAPALAKMGDQNAADGV